MEELIKKLNNKELIFSQEKLNAYYKEYELKSRRKYDCMNSVKQYLKFVRPYIWHIIGTILIGILKFGIPLLIPLILRYVIDNIIGGDMSDFQKLSDLFWLMGISFGIFLLLIPPIEYVS